VTANDEVSVMAPRARPQERNFLLFWISQGFDGLGDAFAKIIIPLLVLDVTGSVAQMGLVTAIIGVGSLIASISSGLFIDRINRRVLMMVCDAARVTLYCLIPMGWQIIGPSIWIIYVVTAVCAYLSTIFIMTHTAAIPLLVPSEDLMAANSKIQATIGLSYVMGPMLAGVSADRLGSGTGTVVMVGLYAISLVLMIFVRMPASPDERTAEDYPAKKSVLGEYLSGIRYIIKHPVLVWVAVLLGAFALMSEATIDLVIFRLKSQVDSERTIGLVFGIASVGAIVGAVAAPALRRKWGFGKCFLGSLMVQGASILLTGIAGRVWLIAALAVTFSLGLMMRNINSMSYRQEVTPSHLLGRVTAAFWSILLALGPIGAVVGTAVAQRTSAPAALIGMGVLGIGVAFAGIFTPVRAQ
jgi:MFS family permease